MIFDKLENLQFNPIIRKFQQTHRLHVTKVPPNINNCNSLSDRKIYESKTNKKFYSKNENLQLLSHFFFFDLLDEASSNHNNTKKFNSLIMSFNFSITDPQIFFY